MEHESNGNLSAAYECYQKAVDISPSIAYDLIQVLKKENVSYVVAPYEADAQMTFLALNKHIDAVITEDSDLIAFGCPRIIYKMDKFGQGVEFKNALLQHNKELNLAGFTQMMLLEMCILSGCDYLQSLPGMGLKKAHTLMKKFRSHENVIKHLKYNNVEVTPLYEESFKKAILTFRHQRVYDPVSEDIVNLSEPTGIINEDLDFLGPSMPQHIAKGIARGDLDPFTKEPIQRESHAAEKVLHGTYQLKNFKPDGERKKIDLPVQTNLLTNYFCFASLEAKRKFRAPRIIPNESSESSSPCINANEVNLGSESNELRFSEAQDHGPSEEREVVGYTQMKPLTLLQSSVCKPCISLHKDVDSYQQNRKVTSVNENGIVKSTYFLKKSREENKSDENKNGDLKPENVVSNHACELLSGLPEGTYRKEGKTVAVQSSYVQHSIKQNANGEKEKVQTHRWSDLDAGEFKRATNNRKHRVWSSYFEEASGNENEVPESVELAVKDVADDPSNSLECTMKKRKIAQTESPRDDGSDSNGTSGTFTSDLEEEMKAEEGKFGSNISHLGRYSDIAEKSMDNFVSVISSFRYNSSGSRASGLRAPLKDIKNNYMRSSTTPDVDLRKFMYAPTKKTTTSRYHKA